MPLKKSISKILLSIMGAASFFGVVSAEKLVILHTNDTHSTIDPLADGTGGILQRKAIIDSVRNVEENVILVDAGDIVQGTLYFKYFKGDVEYPLMNMSGYDIRVLGNHEFDNGMESLAKYYKDIKGEALSANYDFTGTALDGIFKPYTIKEIGGKKIGFIGINIDPVSMIAQKNIDVNFLEVLPTANKWASYLKNVEGCDIVAVISHIGYDKVNDKASDIELAESSKDIDLIIGGHTHTLIDPSLPEEYPSLILNSEGRQVRVVQTGKQGRYIGKLSIDLEQEFTDGENIDYELIPVTDRFPDEVLDKEMSSYLQPFRAAVDSANNIVIAYCEEDLVKQRTGGLANLTADIAFQYGTEIADSLRKLNPDFPAIDMSIMNVGGIRHEMTAGPITEGQILSTYPFSNLFVIISLKGKDLIEALKVSSLKGGEAISGNVIVTTNKIGEIKKVIINGQEMDPDKEYTVVTIDYVAEGNDDLSSMANHKKLWVSDEEVSKPILRWMRHQNSLGLKVNPDMRSRFVLSLNQD